MPGPQRQVVNDRLPGTSRSKPKKHRARDAIGFGGLAAIRISTGLDVARRRGPWVRASSFVPSAQTGVRSGPLASRAPSVFFEVWRISTAGGSRRLSKNPGGGALAKRTQRDGGLFDK